MRRAHEAERRGFASTAFRNEPIEHELLTSTSSTARYRITHVLRRILLELKPMSRADVGSAGCGCVLPVRGRGRTSEGDLDLLKILYDRRNLILCFDQHTQPLSLCILLFLVSLLKSVTITTLWPKDTGCALVLVRSYSILASTIFCYEFLGWGRARLGQDSLSPRWQFNLLTRNCLYYFSIQRLPDGGQPYYISWTQSAMVADRQTLVVPTHRRGELHLGGGARRAWPRLNPKICS